MLPWPYSGYFGAECPKDSRAASISVRMVWRSASAQDASEVGLGISLDGEPAGRQRHVRGTQILI